MSRLGSLLAGVGFRTSTPAFAPGDEVTLYVTGRNDAGPIARVGDTRLHVDGAPDGEPIVDKKVRLRVESFDGGRHEGRATYIETVGESAF